MTDNTQAENTASPQKSVGAKPNTVSNFVIGTWLLFLYIATISISILMLSSYQIQSRMQFIQISDAKFSIWRMIELSNAYSLERDDLELKQNFLLQEREKLNNITARRVQLDIQYTGVFDPYYADIREFKNTIEQSTDFRFKKLGKHYSSVQYLFNDIARQTTGMELSDNLKEQVADLEARAKAGDDIFRNLNSAKTNEDDTKRLIAESSRELRQIAEKVKEGLSGVISRMPQLNKLEGADLAALQDAVSEFSALKEILWRWPYRMAIMPAELLVLFLVLAMGVLGSTIFITQLFFRREKYHGRSAEDLDMVFFFSRPWFGAITAMSIYVLAKSGVLFLTDPSTQSGNATLSPFFISFIAIISGLFSEQAIQAIKGAADDWFKSQSVTSERWGVGLKAAIASGKFKAEQFAEVSGVPVNSVNAWIAEDKPVPTDMQNILSVWLGAPKRSLFTDLPPPNREPESA